MALIVLYVLLLIVLTPPLGKFMYRVYTRERIGRIEGVIYRLIGVDPNAEQTWRRYASACLWFSAVSMVFIYALMRLQGHLPLNPNHIPAVNEYVSWGYYEQGQSNYQDGFQSPPVNWTVNTENKKQFFELVRKVTGA